MPTKKTSTKKTAAKGKKSSKASARIPTGALPPYGDPIRAAVARGDAREMKNVATSARKWLSDVESALAELESAIKKSGA
jgi:Domain of unknown function (DUF1843)